MKRFIPAVLAFTTASFLASDLARAHGRPLRVEHLALDPSRPERIVLGTTFGLVVSDDEGASWRWVCAAAYGADPTQEEPDIVIAGDGSVLLGTFDGVARGEPDLCDYTFPEGPLHDVFAIDVARDPADADTVWSLASTGIEPDLVVRSEDDGRTWAVVGEPIVDILTERVAVAPSDPQRVYVSGAIHATGDRAQQAFVLRSEDGGATFSTIEIPLVDGERLPLLAGIDPTNADRVFVRMARGNVDPRPERLLYSDDGGDTFTSVLELTMLRAFAISADGQTVWAGSGYNGGLWIARGGATTFEQIHTLDVRCLESRGDTLFVCADQLTAGFAFGRSTNEGADIEELLRFQELEEQVSCPRCSSSGVTCPVWIPDLRADIATYFSGADAGMTGLPRDAGLPAECRPDSGPEPPPPPPPPPSCACSARPLRGASILPLFVAAILALTVRTGPRSAGRSRTRDR